MNKDTLFELMERIQGGIEAPNLWEQWVLNQHTTLRFPRAHREVFIAWGIFIERNGAVLPSIKEIAQCVVCSERTVQRALKNAQLFGVLDENMKPVIGSGS